MKKQLLLLIMFLSMVGIKAFAYDIAVENADGVTVYYNYLNAGTELEVTNNGLNSYRGSVVIPELVTYMNRTRKVTSIGKDTFGKCYLLTSITIPNSVTKIGLDAFQGCSSNLNAVYISNLESWCNISFANHMSNPLWYAHRLFLNGDEIKDLVIPNSVTSIGDYAFDSFESLTSIMIPNSVTSIGNQAFFKCSGLTSVHISDLESWCKISFATKESNPLYYAHHLFLNREEIHDLVIPNSVTSIGDKVFWGCTGLTSITIPNSVTSIGYSAFSDCGGLTSVTIPNSVVCIGGYAFSGCEILEIISRIENPFIIETNIFSNNTFLNASLYVPTGSIDKYKATNGWDKFAYIEESDSPFETNKCEKPTISYSNGKLMFNCSTEGATCQSSITDKDIASFSTNEVQLSATYNISVYATKAGYENSETVTATLCWIDLQPKTEGITDGVAQLPAKTVLIQSNGGQLTIHGLDDCTKVSVYGINGTQAGLAVSNNGSAVINTNLQPGNVAIVKIGDKSIKIIIK